jgi:hypothetical protein
MTDIPPEEVSALLVRVKGAKGADREIDYALAQVALGYAIHDEPVFDFHTGWTDKTIKVMSAFGADERKDWELIPEWTSSLDAAVALVERVRPGCRYVLSGGDSGWSSTLQWVGDDGKVHGTRTGDDDYESGALALITALLESLSDG